MICLIHHSLIKSSLFLTSGNILLGYRQPADRRHRQPGRSMPKTFVAFFGGFAGISGFPPFGIFIGELFIIIGAFRTGNIMWRGLFILSLCVIFAGFANNIMKISFDDSDTTVRIEEKTPAWSGPNTRCC
jgi:hydrogenase-4 component F